MSLNCHEQLYYDAYKIIEKVNMMHHKQLLSFCHMLYIIL